MPIFRIGVILSARERKLVRRTFHHWARVHEALSKGMDARVAQIDTQQVRGLLNELSEVLRRKLD
jgi:hypothetical protein